MPVEVSEPYKKQVFEFFDTVWQPKKPGKKPGSRKGLRKQQEEAKRGERQMPVEAAGRVLRVPSVSFGALQKARF